MSSPFPSLALGSYLFCSSFMHPLILIASFRWSHSLLISSIAFSPFWFMACSLFGVPFVVVYLGIAGDFTLASVINENGSTEMIAVCGLVLR